jgi:hypothetical protein
MKKHYDKDEIISIVYFVVFLLLGTYFILIETWLLPVKVVIFIVLGIVLKVVCFPKNKK